MKDKSRFIVTFSNIITVSGHQQQRENHSERVKIQPQNQEFTNKLSKKKCNSNRTTNSNKNKLP